MLLGSGCFCGLNTKGITREAFNLLRGGKTPILYFSAGGHISSFSLPCGEQKRHNAAHEICVNWPARGCPTVRAKWLGLHRPKGGLLANGQSS
jgi:hypothetical protein